MADFLPDRLEPACGIQDLRSHGQAQDVPKPARRRVPIGQAAEREAEESSDTEGVKHAFEGEA